MQLTWCENYQKVSDKLSVDFVSKTQLLRDPIHATEILISDMKEGGVTSKFFDNFTLKAAEFVETFQIIMEKDKTLDIARITRVYNRDLKIEGYGEGILPMPVIGVLKQKPAFR